VTLRELDCDTADTAFRSLSALTTIEVPELRRRMLTVHLDEFDMRSSDLHISDANAWLWRRLTSGDDTRPVPDVVARSP
jgi:hypothetical protein